MNCKSLYDQVFLTASYADSRSILPRDGAPALAWLDECIEAIRARSFFEPWFYLKSPHLTIRRLSKRLADPTYKPQKAAAVFVKDLGEFVQRDRVLKKTAMLPLVKKLLGVIDQPYSQFAARLVREIERMFDAGDYLAATIREVGLAVAGGEPEEALSGLGLATVAGLLLMGYSDRASEELLLRTFDVPRDSPETWLFPDERHEVSWVIPFQDRLNALTAELFGKNRPFVFVFPVFGADLAEEATLDGCRFYDPSSSSRFSTSAERPNPELTLGHGKPNSVHAEVSVDAPNAPRGHQLARERLSKVVDRLQNLMPIHRSPVVLGEKYLRTSPQFDQAKVTVLPHDFVHGALLNHEVVHEYEEFYSALKSYESNEFLQTLWSHAKRARDSRSIGEKFLSYWTILERICDEARVHRVLPEGATLTATMADLLMAPRVLSLPVSVCQRLVDATTFATLAPFHGPMSVFRMRLRFRSGTTRAAFARCNSVAGVVAALPGLAASPMSGQMTRMVRWACEFFGFGALAVEEVQQYRGRAKTVFTMLYELRNELVHDATLDGILLPQALEALEGLVGLWLRELSSAALHRPEDNAADTLRDLYYESIVVEERLASGQIASLDDWSTNIKRQHIHVERRPQFGPEGSIFGEF